ncbi:TetR/AcrR family transcriptional regulator [Micropruina sp.]|uniref:TetR/AcrR family transcriptional regulator n=1 Tax=Micropruina sp. TaxID=2737536 RepID=UPI002620D401|nr:TetR/AcrR family transcriptional regulator [Micropruina sp.]
MTTTTERSARSHADKFSARRTMLAQSALTALAEHGFADTGLRDIAHYSALSHGSLHYYFDDKDDLIAEAVWAFKSTCARRYDEIVATATDCTELATQVAALMATTLRKDAALHRLWYDLRNQALFGRGFGSTIVRIDELLQEMVWSIVARYSELHGSPSRFEPAFAYALVDGLFQHALISFLRGDLDAPERLQRECAALLASAV